MEVQNLLISSFDSFKESIEKEHKDNINPIEYTPNYGRLIEAKIIHSTLESNESLTAKYDNINLNLSDISLEIENSYIIHSISYRTCRSQYNTFKHITEYFYKEADNLLIDNYGNIYKYVSTKNNQIDIKLINKNKISNIQLNNFIINYIKSISFFIKKTEKIWINNEWKDRSYYKTFTYRQGEEYIDIYNIFDTIFDMFRYINKYIYEKFVLSNENLKLDQDKLNIESIIDNNHKLSSDLKDSLIQIEKLKRQLDI
jgi:hypothetical protein